jgi:tetratricopeptide (TPR) repeat protein
MKKLLVLLCFLGLYSLNTFAQTDNDYEDLLTLFVDEKYEKCLYKAEGYTLNEKTKKDPLPYLFVSRCYFQISKMDEFKEKYPDPFKDAMKYISKYAAKDKERTYVADYEEFLSELRKEAIAQAESQFDAAKYTKAKTLYDQIADMDPNDAGAQVMLAITFSMMKAKKDAELALGKAEAILKENKASMLTEQKDLLKNSLMKYAILLSDQGDRSTAVKWLEYGMEYFKEDPEYKVTFETIKG